MSDGESPPVLRRRLRTELRAARLRKGLTRDQVAGAMDWSLSKMNRIEKAKSGISVNDVRVLLELYDITDTEQAEELFALARAARRSPWWSRYREVSPPGLLDLIGFESAASAVSQFEIVFVPGILQTAEYASAVLRVFYEESAPERVPSLVELRTRRRDLLTSVNAPRFSFVLDESIIHRLVGSPAIMSQQFMHLVDMAELPNVTIQVAPFAVGLHPGTRGPYEIVEFDDTPDENILFLESARGDMISDAPEETRNYLEAFRRITEAALGPSDSVDRLRAAASQAA